MKESNLLSSFSVLTARSTSFHNLAELVQPAKAHQTKESTPKDSRRNFWTSSSAIPNSLTKKYFELAGSEPVAIERSFRLDSSVPVPPDAQVLFPELPPQIHTFDLGGAKEVLEQIMGKFLVVSIETASYVVLDLDVLDAFHALHRGESLAQVLARLSQSLGERVARKKLHGLLLNLLARNFLIGATKKEYLPAAPNIQMYVTNRCNLRCRHCNMDAGEPLVDEIDTKLRRKAIRIFAELYPGGLITFTGGEALLSSDIFALMKYAQSLGLRNELYSNGILMQDDFLAEHVVESADEVQVSLDGATPEVNDAIRGLGTFQGILRAIQTLDAAAHRMNKKTFRLRIAVTLTHINVDDIRTNIIALISSLDLLRKPQIRMGMVGKRGRAARDAEILSNQSSLQLMQAAIVNELAAKGVYRFPAASKNRYSRSCGIGLTVTIGADGQIYPCSITDQPPVGHIRDVDADAKFREVFSYFARTSVDNVKGCQDCVIRYFCGGTCRINNLNNFGLMTQSACTQDFKEVKVRDLIGTYASYNINIQ